MASFTVGTGTTDTIAKTVSNSDTGTIQSGGTLSDTTDITWTGGSASPGVIINNSGTIDVAVSAAQHHVCQCRLWVDAVEKSFDPIIVPLDATWAGLPMNFGL
jgi:hypothetical protein